MGSRVPCDDMGYLYARLCTSAFLHLFLADGVAVQVMKYRKIKYFQSEFELHKVFLFQFRCSKTPCIGTLEETSYFIFFNFGEILELIFLGKFAYMLIEYAILATSSPRIRHTKVFR